MKFTALGKNSLRYLIGIAFFILLIFLALFVLLKQLSISEPEPRRPCEFTDSIKLKLGEAQVIFPVETNLLIIEGEGEPKFRRRRVHAKSLFIRACYDNKPFRLASSLNKTIINRPRADPTNTEIEKQRPSYIYVSLFPGMRKFMADGIYQTRRFEHKPDGTYRRFSKEKTGYKLDASDCFVIEKIGWEKCSIYRYLKDVDLTISMGLETSDVNSYGRSVYKGRQQSREYWPELMDREEKYWRAFIVENEDIAPLD